MTDIVMDYSDIEKKQKIEELTPEKIQQIITHKKEKLDNYLKEIQKYVMLYITFDKEEEKELEDKENKLNNEKKDVKKKIEITTAKNQANLEKMNLKNKLVQDTVDEALKKLKSFALPDNNSYKKLLKELILECMVKLLEKECFIKIRKDDANYVKSIMKDCESEFVKLMKKETKRDYECKLSILEDDFIEDEYGGVILMNKDKKIIINNGLKDRLMLTKEHHLPEIKRMLFPKA